MVDTIVGFIWVCVTPPIGAAVVTNGISGGLAVTLLSAAAIATKAPNIAINSVPSLNEGFHTKDQPYIEAGKKIHKLIS
ncbi:hypothetical protein [uncultured Thalassolituus sp.]|uniref:hypothetical protein n=1 Tax=uncultured Thalassolituus sp. TaxID=285273 RepID=UPI0026066E4F|nr:hypothetical protein [uncultured Thalassolituus sp.]